MAKPYHINEIFYSLQGEGFHTGRAAVFVRFSGCNLRCNFCDTQHEPFTTMTTTEICDVINQYPNDAIIVLTGGEPSLFIDEQFIETLKNGGTTKRYITIETNGTHLLPKNIDWVTLSPKVGFPGGSQTMNDIVLTHCDELKVVNCGQDFSQYDHIQANHRFIQPCYLPDNEAREANLRNCIEFVKRHPSWRLSLQTHRMINIQ